MGNIPLTLQSIVIAGLLGLLVGMGGGGFIVYEFYSPRLALCKTENASLGETIKVQNAGVKRLADEGIARAKKAGEAVAAAQASAIESQRHALDVMSRQPPAGVEPCVAARSLITEELARLKGVK